MLEEFEPKGGCRDKEGRDNESKGSFPIPDSQKEEVEIFFRK